MVEYSLKSLFFSEKFYCIGERVPTQEVLTSFGKNERRRGGKVLPSDFGLFLERI